MEHACFLYLLLLVRSGGVLFPRSALAALGRRIKKSKVYAQLLWVETILKGSVSPYRLVFGRNIRVLFGIPSGRLTSL